jgi:hypothetical protein
MYCASQSPAQEELQPPRRLSEEQARALWADILTDPNEAGNRKKVKYFNGKLNQHVEEWAIGVETDLIAITDNYKKVENSVVQQSRIKHASKEKLG